MIVAIAGGGGFLGRWLAREAQRRGAVVHVGARDAVRAVGMLQQSAIRARVAMVDASDHAGMQMWLGSVRPDVVINAIGYGVDPGERDEQVAHQVNALWPSVLVSCVAAVTPTSRIVHLGSAQEYGRATGDLAEDGRAEPTTLYGRTKLEGTRAAHAIAERSGVSLTTARLFTVFGAGEHASRLLPTLQRAAREDSPIPLTDGRQRRDFACAADVAEAVLDLAATPRASGKVVNVASGALYPVRAFVEVAARELGIDAGRLRFGDVATRPDEMQHEPVTTARLRELIGRSLTTDLATAVRRALKE